MPRKFSKLGSLDLFRHVCSPKQKRCSLGQYYNYTSTLWFTCSLGPLERKDLPELWVLTNKIISYAIVCVETKRKIVRQYVAMKLSIQPI